MVNDTQEGCVSRSAAAMNNDQKNVTADAECWNMGCECIGLLIAHTRSPFFCSFQYKLQCRKQGPMTRQQMYPF
jgi:hypothetical protein